MAGDKVQHPRITAGGKDAKWHLSSATPGFYPTDCIRRLAASSTVNWITSRRNGFLFS